MTPKTKASYHHISANKQLRLQRQRQQHLHGYQDKWIQTLQSLNYIKQDTNTQLKFIHLDHLFPFIDKFSHTTIQRANAKIQRQFPALNIDPNKSALSNLHHHLLRKNLHNLPRQKPNLKIHDLTSHDTTLLPHQKPSQALLKTLGLGLGYCLQTKPHKDTTYHVCNTAGAHA